MNTISKKTLVRITYVSRYDEASLTKEEITSIVKKSATNNAKLSVTGFLTAARGVFFQTIEGEIKVIDELKQKIAKDPRHFDFRVLQVEHNVERSFPDWHMEHVNLTDEIAYFRPIRVLLYTLAESHNILEKYTQPTVVNYITKGINPLVVPPKRTHKVIMFADIMSFTSFSEKLPPETVVGMVNTYLEVVTSTVQKHGGEVSKYIADCVLAYFEGDETGAQSAVRASLEILSTLQILRETSMEFALPMVVNPLRHLYCGIGLSLGSVLEGNIGSKSKKDYTLIGDAVNVGARLEAYTRSTPYYMVFDSHVYEKVQGSMSKNIQFLENVNLKGKKDQVAIYTITDAANSKPKGLKETISAFLDAAVPRRKKLTFFANLAKLFAPRRNSRTISPV